MLVQQSLQIALTVALIGLVTKLFARNRPHLACALWVIVLIKCITPPIWSSTLSPFSWLATWSTPSLAKQQHIETGIDSPNAATNLSGIQRPQSNNVTFFQWILPDEEIEAIASSEPPAHPNVKPNAKAGSSLSWLGTLWLGSVLFVGGYFAIRYSIFCYWLRSARRIPNARIEAILDRLRCDLNIKRDVRVAALDFPLGPAVIGIMKPMILLPARIVDELSDDALRALIAHELIHIRRGDLICAMVQTIVSSLWWFHPAVWFANRSLSCEIERRCDEETIASIGCSNTTYARCLLAVLEQKHQLRLAPVLPGVRPVQITISRMERIMKLKHGCNRSTPAWVWAVMLLCCPLVLPGAAVVLAQPPAPVQPSQPAAPPLPAPPKTIPAGRLPGSKLVAYDIADLLVAIVDDQYADASQAVPALIASIGNPPATKDVKKDEQPVKTYPSPIDLTPKPAPPYSPPTAEQVLAMFPYQVEKNTLIVHGPPQVHEHVKSRLAHFRKNGFQSISTRISMIKCDFQVELDGVTWTNDKDPVAVIDKEQSQSLIELPKTKPDAKVLMAPRLIGGNGVTVSVQTGQERGWEIKKPGQDSVTRGIIETGTRLDTTATQHDDGSIQIQFQATIRDEIPLAEEKRETEPPQVFTQSISVTAEVAEGKTLAIRTKAQIDEFTRNPSQSYYIFLIYCEPVSMSEMTSALKRDSVPPPAPPKPLPQNPLPPVRVEPNSTTKPTSQLRLEVDGLTAENKSVSKNDQSVNTLGLSKEQSREQFSKMGVNATIEGDAVVSLSTNADGGTSSDRPAPSMEIRGTEIKLQWNNSQTGNSEVTSDRGVIGWVITPERTETMENFGFQRASLEGNVVIRNQTQDYSIYADRVVIDGPVIRFFGNVKLKHAKTTAFADEIRSYDASDWLELSGKAFFERIGGDGDDVRIRANSIRWNVLTNEVSSDAGELR